MVNLRNKYYQEVMITHTNKIARLLYKETDVDEHIHNISSYELSFFQKLVLCRGLKFAFPQRVSPIEVKASFEKAYWSLEPHLESDDLKELVAATLREHLCFFIQKLFFGNQPANPNGRQLYPLLTSSQSKTTGDPMRRVP